MAIVKKDFYMTDAIGEVVAATNTKLNSSFLYFFGEDEHVVKALRDRKAAGEPWVTIVALTLPVDIIVGKAGGYYGTATIPRIVIASVTNPQDSPAVRQEAIIKPAIVPFYNEFLKQIGSRTTPFVTSSAIDHTQRIRFGTQAAAQGFTEYIDGIEIINLKLTIKQKCQQQ